MTIAGDMGRKAIKQTKQTTLFMVYSLVLQSH